MSSDCSKRLKPKGMSYKWIGFGPTGLYVTHGFSLDDKKVYAYPFQRSQPKALINNHDKYTIVFSNLIP